MDQCPQSALTICSSCATSLLIKCARALPQKGQGKQVLSPPGVATGKLRLRRCVWVVSSRWGLVCLPNCRAYALHQDIGSRPFDCHLVATAMVGEFKGVTGPNEAALSDVPNFPRTSFHPRREDHANIRKIRKEGKHRYTNFLCWVSSDQECGVYPDWNFHLQGPGELLLTFPLSHWERLITGTLYPD